MAWGACVAGGGVGGQKGFEADRPGSTLRVGFDDVIEQDLRGVDKGGGWWGERRGGGKDPGLLIRAVDSLGFAQIGIPSAHSLPYGGAPHALEIRGSAGGGKGAFAVWAPIDTTFGGVADARPGDGEAFMFALEDNRMPARAVGIGAAQQHAAIVKNAQPGRVDVLGLGERGAGRNPAIAQDLLSSPSVVQRTQVGGCLGRSGSNGREESSTERPVLAKIEGQGREDEVHTIESQAFGENHRGVLDVAAFTAKEGRHIHNIKRLGDEKFP